MPLQFHLASHSTTSYRLCMTNLIFDKHGEGINLFQKRKKKNHEPPSGYKFSVTRTQDILKQAYPPTKNTGLDK